MHPLMKLALGLLAAAILLSGCGQPKSAEPASSTPAPGNQAAAPEPTPRPMEKMVRQNWTAGSPEAAAQAFYEWYLSYKGNPTAEGAYRTNPYVHPEWSVKVDAKVKEWKESGGPGFDPFLCAQNKANEVIAGPADVVGGKAALMVYLGPWGDPANPTWTRNELYLTLNGKQWQITRIVCTR